MKSLLVSIAALFLALTSALSETEIPIENPGFELGTDGWAIREKTPMSTVTADAAHEGSQGLHVQDEDTVNGSSALSTVVPVEPGKTYTLTFWARTNSVNAASVSFWFFTQSRQLIGAGTQTIPGVVITHTNGDWFEYQLTAPAPSEAVTLGIWIHTFSTAVGTVDFDDFKLTSE
ncbi:hypothetical protein BH09VER1_BH09VER1_37990 [soil metagenome]